MPHAFLVCIRRRYPGYFARLNRARIEDTSVALRTPEQIWKDCCAATVDIRAQHGMRGAIEYLIGDKLMMFAQTGETNPEFLAELPAFSKRIRKLFTAAEIEDHFERAEYAARVDPDIMKGASAEEIEQLQEGFEDDRRSQERRDWVKAMLLRSGS